MDQRTPMTGSAGIGVLERVQEKEHPKSFFQKAKTFFT